MDDSWDRSLFDKELKSILDAKLPVSASKINALQSLAISHPKVTYDNSKEEDTYRYAYTLRWMLIWDDDDDDSTTTILFNVLFGLLRLLHQTIGLQDCMWLMPSLVQYKSK